MARGRRRTILGWGLLTVAVSTAVPWASSARTGRLITLAWHDADLTLAESGGILSVRGRGPLGAPPERPSVETEAFAPDEFRWRLADADRWIPGEDFRRRFDDRLGLVHASLGPEYAACLDPVGWSLAAPPAPREEFNLRMVGWLPTALLLTPAAVLLMSARRARRPDAPRGCRRCGYDLTGAPAACPECGQAPESCGAAPLRR